MEESTESVIEYLNPIISEHIKNLELINKDIKFVEKFIKSSAINHNEKFKISDSTYLCFYDGRIYFVDNDKKTRLGECNSRIRLQVGKYLPSFLKFYVQIFKEIK